MKHRYTTILTPQARHFASLKPHKRHHRFRHQAMKAVFTELEGLSHDTIRVGGLDDVVTTELPKLAWTDFPYLPKNCFRVRNTFNALEYEPSDEFGETLFASTGRICSLGAEEVGEVVLLGWATMHVGRALARLAMVMRSIGHRPQRVCVIKANFSGYNCHWVDWSDIEAEENVWLPMLRFETLYNMNFRGLATSAMERCIAGFAERDENLTQFPPRSLPTHRISPAFVAMLEMVGRNTTEHVWHRGASSNVGLMIWRRAIGGDADWESSAGAAMEANFSSDFSIGAAVKPCVPFVMWKGSGSLGSLVSSAFSTTPYPAEYIAAQFAYILGFIEAHDGSVRLTSSGRMFLDILPQKVRDVDAPIRWHHVGPEEAQRADAWMERHFRMFKRAVNSNNALRQEHMPT